ncbi:hypothetical protein V7139_21415 [Neobacillus drentensis]|uniref:hypothetical protein n=1 Tax=Neobacillus drentensis TaxID=220684 RepID=UPI0030020B92
MIISLFLEVVTFAKYDNKLPMIDMVQCLTGLRKGEFGLVLSFLDGNPAEVMEFMPTGEKEEAKSATSSGFRE